MKGAENVDTVLARMQENYRCRPCAIESESELYRAGSGSHSCSWFVSCSKYKYIEMQLLQRKRTLQRKLPEIQKTAEMVRYLIEKRVRPSQPRQPCMHV